MDIFRIAESISNSNSLSSSDERDLLHPPTEYSCKVEISLIADFEGTISKPELLKKLKTEILAAIEESINIVSRETGIQATSVIVKPLVFDCAVNDPSSIEDDINFSNTLLSLKLVKFFHVN